MSRGKLYTLFFTILVLTALGIFVVSPKGTKVVNVTNPYTFVLGLDLEGGTHLEYQGDLNEISAEKRAAAMESLRSAIERRIQGSAGGGLGVSEPLIQTAGKDRLIVELPGVKDIQKAIEVIGQTPFLEFREPGDSGSELSENPDAWKATGLTGKNLESANVDFDQVTGQPQILLTFDSEGDKLFESITERNVGQPIAVFLDGQLLQSPIVQQKISGGSAVISGSFKLEEAKTIVSRLNSGALPVPIKLIGQKTVGATLGELSLEKSLTAGLIGMLAIILFMIIFYRLPGLLASMALVVYALISLSIFKILPVTLTLSGIAGFILSIGMAVDANILIFERMKEELRLGKDLRLAVQDGFARAWLSIRDSNISTIITTAILFMFGTGIVKGFAITLFWGVIISMFTAITVTRTFLLLFLGRKAKVFSHPWLYGVHAKKE